MGSKMLTYDENGNMTSDGVNTYSWDAENRLIQINYPGSGNNSQMTFDPLGRNVKIVENTGGSTTSTKQFVWCDDRRCEERDGSGGLTKKLFKGGQQNSSTNYFYTLDHLDSVREMLDSSGGILAQYAFELFGRQTKLQGSTDSDFQFATFYSHSPSGLHLAQFREYRPSLGRWIRRDPIGEIGGLNLHIYAFNRPSSIIAPTGLDSWNIPLETLANNLGLPSSALGGGCLDVVNAALGMPSVLAPGGRRPDAHKTTKCWFGPMAQRQAQDYVNSACDCDGVVWQKRGIWQDRNAPPLGPVDPRMIQDRPVDYTTLWTRPSPYLGMYVDMTGAGKGGRGNAHNRPIPGPSGEIWCGTCKIVYGRTR
ncbi:MAG: RHS repeat-associated core domain-containing protein [Candidatus Obscuribacterales bacterium]|nr:RHS repeat-associated core domain-containing protein [Candidatus Obscuribacterales bacterium]